MGQKLRTLTWITYFDQMYSSNNYIYSHNKYLIIKPDKQSLFRNSETRSLSSIKSIEYGIWHSSKIRRNYATITALYICNLQVIPQGIISTSDCDHFNHEFLSSQIIWDICWNLLPNDLGFLYDSWSQYRELGSNL